MVHPNNGRRRMAKGNRQSSKNGSIQNNLPQCVDYNELKRERHYELNNKNNNNINSELLEYAYPRYINRLYHGNNNNYNNNN
ncbi:unnamed protein product, partial [Didymodactylos carnosus]